MTTSKRISLLFAWYVTAVVMVFGIIINIGFFLSRYGIVTSPAGVSPKAWTSDQLRPVWQWWPTWEDKPQDFQLFRRVMRRPLMWLQQALIVITEPDIVSELAQRQWWLNLINFQDQIWHYSIVEDRAVLTLVDSLIDSQLLLIYITLAVAILLAIISYWISMWLVQHWLKPLYQLADHIEHTQDPTTYQHLSVWPEDDELQEVSTAFTRAMSTIAGQTRKLKQFVTHASHELKTPLMTISSTVDLMTKSGVDTPHTQSIKYTVSSMKTLIDRLMTTMRHDDLQSQKIDTARLIQQSIERVITSHPTSFHQIDVAITDPLIKHSDPVVCECIVSNLIDNAYKYATSGSTITITATDEFMTITNQFDPEQAPDLELIRQPFYRADESRTDGTSHGLWLTIVQQMVERAGWQIETMIEWNTISFSVYR